MVNELESLTVSSALYQETKYKGYIVRTLPIVDFKISCSTSIISSCLSFSFFFLRFDISSGEPFHWCQECSYLLTKILLLWNKFFLKWQKYFVMRMEPIISLETYLLGMSCHPEKCLEDLRDSYLFCKPDVCQFLWP